MAVISKTVASLSLLFFRLCMHNVHAVGLWLKLRKHWWYQYYLLRRLIAFRRSFICTSRPRKRYCTSL